jgi:simple sugar transport system substrate-binding protein
MIGGNFSRASSYSERGRSATSATVQGRAMTILRRTFIACLLASSAVFAAAQTAVAAEPTVTIVVKIEGIPWFTALRKGVVKAGKDFGVNATMIGPATDDPAQQVRLVEDLIAKKVDAIGLVPLDEKVMEPVLERAQQAGIPVITHEGPDQKGRTWNVDLIDSTKLGEAEMQSLAKAMGEEGEYVALVGTLTTPLHNKWADAAIAYQKAHYPKMKLVGDRFPYNDSTDIAFKTTLDVLKAYPNLKGILAEGANAPIGAGNALRQAHMGGGKIKLVGTMLPSQARSLILDGTIYEGFNWNPIEAGYAMVAVAKLVLDKKEIKDGMDIPGMGPAQVDAANRRITINKIQVINKDTVEGYVKEGL